MWKHGTHCRIHIAQSLGTCAKIRRSVLDSWKSEEHVKFSLQWSPFRIRRQLRVLAHDLCHLTRHQHCLQFLITSDNGTYKTGCSSTRTSRRHWSSALLINAATAASTHGHYARRLRHCSSNRSLAPTSRNVLFGAPRSLSRTHFPHLLSEAIHCLYFKSRLKHFYFVSPITSTHNRLPSAPLKLRPIRRFTNALVIIIIIIINAQARDTVAFCGWSADWRHQSSSYILLWNIHAHQLADYASEGPLLMCWWSFHSRKWRRIKFQFFYFGLNCGENIVKFALLTHVLQNLYHSCCLYQSGQSHSCRLHRSVQWFIWFDNSLSHSQGNHSHRILEPLKKTSSPSRYFAAANRLLWIFECLQNYDIFMLTGGDIDGRQANNPSCWTQRSDVSHWRCWCSATIRIRRCNLDK